MAGAKPFWSQITAPYPMARVGAAAFYLTAALHLGWWSALQWRYGVNVPFADQWTFLHHYIVQTETDGFSWRDALSPYGESRKLLPNFLTVSLIAYFSHFDPRREYSVFLLMFLGLAALLRVIGRRTDLGSVSTGGLVLVCVALYWSPATQPLHVFSITFERLAPQLFLLAGICFSFFKLGAWRLAAVFGVFSVLGSLSFVSGLALWPLFAALSVLVRPRPASLYAAAILLIGFAVFLHFYLQDLPLGGRGFDAVADNPAGAVIFFLKVLGLAFGRRDGAALIGGSAAVFILVACTATLAWRSRRFREKPAAESAPWLALSCCGLVQGALITYGRFGTGDILGRPDLIPHSALFIVGVYGLFLSWVRWRSVVTALGVAAAAATIIASPFDPDLKRAAEQWRDHRSAGKACFMHFNQVADLRCVVRTYFVYHDVPEFQWDRILKSSVLPWTETEFRVTSADPGGRVERIKTTSKGRRHIIGWAHQADAEVDAVIAANGDLADPKTQIYAAMDRYKRPDILRIHPDAADRPGFIVKNAPKDLIDSLCDHQFYGLDFKTATAFPIPYRGPCDSLLGLNAPPKRDTEP